MQSGLKREYMGPRAQPKEHRLHDAPLVELIAQVNRHIFREDILNGFLDLLRIPVKSAKQ
jgi:hypothetical protein